MAALEQRLGRRARVLGDDLGGLLGRDGRVGAVAEAVDRRRERPRLPRDEDGAIAGVPLALERRRGDPALELRGPVVGLSRHCAPT